MRSLRRFGLLCAVAAGSAVLAGPAFAARPGALLLPFTIQTPHFVVHYQSDLVNHAQFAITQTMAGDVAALAERAYTAEIADGFPVPPSDGVLGGDGRIDIYVDDPGGPLALTVPDDLAASPTTASIELDGSNEIALQQHTIAHELFHVIQLGIWQPLPFPAHLPDYWLLEGSAEWMGFRVDHYDPSFGIDLGPPDMALDCRDPLAGNMCDLADDYKNNGYSRWPFFEYLAEKYGASFIRDIFTQGAAGAPAATATTAISNALAAKGTTLADTYNAWTQADLIGGYSISTLQGLPPTPYGAWQTGIKGGALGTALVPVNHLSTRILEFDRGNGDATRACSAATLTVTVAVPAGTLSKPVFWWNAPGNPPVPLTVTGSTASVTLPWDTCTYASTKGYLALPNASLAVDAADFAVSATMSVDPTTPASSSAPPGQYFVPTPVVSVTSVDSAPTLTLFGPEVLKLSAGQLLLRLIVESSGQGSVRGRLGAFDLGSISIRGGNNDVRFKLPKNVLNALRRSAGSASNVLTLTPVAATGGATGTPVTRTVRLAPVKKTTKHK